MRPAITVAIGATPEVTRRVVMRPTGASAREVLRARLGPPSQVHRGAAPRRLESLALGHQPPVHVVRSAASAAISSGLPLSDGFSFGFRTLDYDVARGRTRGAELRAGPGAFRALRQRCQP